MVSVLQNTAFGGLIYVQVGMPRYLPWGREQGACLTECLVADSGSAGSLGPCAVLWGKASAMSLGVLWGSLMDDDTPQLPLT